MNIDGIRDFMFNLLSLIFNCIIFLFKNEYILFTFLYKRGFQTYNIVVWIYNSFFFLGGGVGSITHLIYIWIFRLRGLRWGTFPMFKQSHFIGF